MKCLRFAWLGVFWVLAACQTALQDDVEAALLNPDQRDVRWGVVVADESGTELLAIRPDERFTPASNTKIVTTMATYHHLDALQHSPFNPGTRVFLEANSGDTPPNLILYGGADAMLMDDPACEAVCLASLADAVAASGVTEVTSVIGDDSLFPFEPWGPGWSVEDLQYYYGTAVSALSLNDNLVWINVAPGAEPGDPAQVDWQAGDDVFKLSNELETDLADAERRLRVSRDPGGDLVRIYGTLPINSAPLRFGLAIDNPAEFTALRFKHLLQARGISVASVQTRHRALDLSDEVPDPDAETVSLVSHPMLPQTYSLVATLPASRLQDSLKRISKDSENMHAEMALRRLGLLQGTGSREYGLAAIDAFLTEAGIAEHDMTFHGGSGMSVYNRITPRSMVRLLSFAATQPWFDAWLADQPIGGVDGSLERRFKGTVLEGKVFAKTGTLNGANALSGIMVAKSGQRLAFSIIANDRPPNTRSAVPEMDAALVLIAETY